MKFSTSRCQAADRLGELLHPTGPPEGATAGWELGRVGVGSGGTRDRARRPEWEGQGRAARVCPAGPARSPGRTWNRKLAQSLGCVHGGRNSRSRAEWNQRRGAGEEPSAPLLRPRGPGVRGGDCAGARPRGEGVGCRSEAPKLVLAFSQEPGQSLEAAWCVRTHKWLATISLPQRLWLAAARLPKATSLAPLGGAGGAGGSWAWTGLRSLQSSRRQAEIPRGGGAGGWGGGWSGDPAVVVGTGGWPPAAAEGGGDRGDPVVFLLRLGLSPHARLGLEALVGDKLSRGPSPPGRGGSGEERTVTCGAASLALWPAGSAASWSRTALRPGRGGYSRHSARPLVRKSPGNSASSGFRGVRVRGRRGRGAAARGVGLRGRGCERRPGAPGAGATDFGGHAVAPGSPTAGLRRSRAGPAAGLGRQGGSRGGTRTFPGAAGAGGRSRWAPLACWGQRPKAPQKQGVRATPAPGLSAAPRGKDRTHQRPPAARRLPGLRGCVFGPLEGGRGGERPAQTTGHLRAGRGGSWGREHGGTAGEADRGGAVGAWKLPCRPVPPGGPPAGPPLPSRPWPRPLEEPQPSGARSRDSRSLQPGPLPLTRDVLSPRGARRRAGGRASDPAPPSPGQPGRLGSGGAVFWAPLGLGPPGASGAPGERRFLAEPRRQPGEQREERGPAPRLPNDGPTLATGSPVPEGLAARGGDTDQTPLPAGARPRCRRRPADRAPLRKRRDSPPGLSRCPAPRWGGSPLGGDPGSRGARAAATPTPARASRGLVSLCS